MAAIPRGFAPRCVVRGTRGFAPRGLNRDFVPRGLTRGFAPRGLLEWTYREHVHRERRDRIDFKIVVGCIRKPGKNCKPRTKIQKRPDISEWNHWNGFAKQSHSNPDNGLALRSKAIQSKWIGFAKQSQSIIEKALRSKANPS